MGVKVIVSATRRYWAAGRCFEAGDTEVTLEHEQLAELDAARGGQKLEAVGTDRSNPEYRSPPVLTYRVVEYQQPPDAPKDAPTPEKAEAPEGASVPVASAPTAPPPASTENVPAPTSDSKVAPAAAAEPAQPVLPHNELNPEE